MRDDPSALLPVLRMAWSSATSTQWLADNPARGQCNVTTLVVHDMFGGEILKTEAPGGWHFYNRVAGRRHDLTASQFEQPISYADIASDRTEALAGTERRQYGVLKQRIALLMGRGGG